MPTTRRCAKRYNALASNSKALAAWMLSLSFADTAPPQRRNLCQRIVHTALLLSLSMLVALGGCEPQVKLHVAANLRVGNDRARLIDVLTQLLPYIGYPRTLNALRSLNEVLDS